LNLQESLVLYRPKPMARQAQLPFPAQQLSDSIGLCGNTLSPARRS
jgi:hypothetical protein